MSVEIIYLELTHIFAIMNFGNFYCSFSVYMTVLLNKYLLKNLNIYGMPLSELELNRNFTVSSRKIGSIPIGLSDFKKNPKMYKGS